MYFTYSLQLNLVPVPIPVQVSAMLNGVTSTTTIVVLPHPPVLALFDLSATKLRTGRVIVAKASINMPAPSGGSRVSLKSHAIPAGMTIPAEIIIPANEIGGTVPIQVPASVPVGATVTIVASLNGVSKTVTVSVDP